ncbi:NADPH-dependent FMN reductase [Phytoactinopolyspora halophila]|uniref:NADPH-dependent FMN reductase n=1 Tax=Phytoactinopolyspora halophila TaxID=1981511 RepID=UPI00131421FD|nr:NAD(P)H-dependent oxidoreductase [Phytoactinopolyspora halophila]
MNSQRAITIVGIPGSLRRESFNRQLLHAVSHELPPGLNLDVWNGLARIPAFNEDLEDGPVPEAVADLRSAIAQADAALIATPEYNGSIPGQLKNALDWASRPRGSAVLEGKPVATMSASPTPYGAAWAQESLRRVLTIIGAELVGSELAVPQAFQQFDAASRLIAPEFRQQCTGLIGELAARFDPAMTAA